MNEMSFSDTAFTDNAWDVMYDAVDDIDFKNKDADLIYSTLERKLKFISFGDYLKRYIYRKARLTESFDTIPIKTYQRIIMDSFSDNGTPQSFESTTAKLSALSKNWLTQQTVNRKVIFLLGFGLKMNVEDVNLFLTKALRERGINSKNPFEVICWYCYKNNYSYYKYEKLWSIFSETSPNSLDMKLLYDDLTIGARNYMNTINNDASLINFVSKLMTSDNKSQLSVSAKKAFDELFERAKELVAVLYNKEEEEKNNEEIVEYQNRLLNNSRISDFEREARLANKRAQKRVYSVGDITESDLEHIISSAIPVDRHGNLTPSKASKLNAQFSGKRFSRQHISDILVGRSEVTKFDLITLNFFIYSQTLDDYPNAKARYSSFVESTNKVLEHCLLGELYISNPYECFVLMCILSEDPLGTYADVWELSYECQK
jgi:hypothetical protein